MTQKFNNLSSAINALRIYTDSTPRCFFSNDSDYNLLTVTVLVDNNVSELPNSVEKELSSFEDLKECRRVYYEVIECSDKKFKILCNFFCINKNDHESKQSIYLCGNDFDFLELE